jgi:hypothetical protein
MRSLVLRLAAVAGILTGCSAPTSPSSFDRSADSKTPTSDGTLGGGGGTLGGTTSPTTTTDTNQTGCSEEAKLVYVLSLERDLYSFTPDKRLFTKIGNVRCPAGGAEPSSMAVDRSGTAWVNYVDGSLFKVSTKDASCTATKFQRGQSGFLKFGMAFATAAAGSTNETLYVADTDDSGTSGHGLGKIDLTTLTLTRVGDYSGVLKGLGAELTGTGDGRLFGFFTSEPDATLAQLDAKVGSTSANKDLRGVNTGNYWAFSSWGGDFWFYTGTVDQPSKVTRLKTSGDGSLETVIEDVGGFDIVGAGVSTCAPTTPPMPR